MFNYDEMYNILFNDEQFMDILYKFHSSVWKKMTIDDRFKTTEDFIKRYCELFEIPQIKVNRFKKTKNGKSFAGVYADVGGAVYVHHDSVDNISQYDLIDTLFHEMRHNYQYRAIAKRLSNVEDKLSSEVLNAWKLNTTMYPNGRSNYISSGDDNEYLYNYQPIEVDAFKTGITLARRSYELLRDKYGPDAEFATYAHALKQQIMIYFSEEEKVKETTKTLCDEVFKYFKSNHDVGDFENDCFEIASKIREKPLHELELEELYALFSQYVWNRWSIDEKYDILMEYDRRVNKYKPTQIEKMGTTAFKIFDLTCNADNAVSVLNLMFSEQFKTIVKHIVKGKATCSEKMKSDLCINMYKHGDKKINYSGERENYLLYLIQPYGVYEGSNIMKKFEQCKEAQIKFYGRYEKEFDNIINTYDYDKIAHWLEEFFDKPFDKIYEENLERMRQRIIEAELNGDDDEQKLGKIEKIKKSTGCQAVKKR